VLDCVPVGVPGRFVILACALALVCAPAAPAAPRDLSVRVSKLAVPLRLKSGTKVSFGVRYVVQGPATRRAMATVELVLSSPTNRYRVASLPAKVRPAIWKWSVRDTLPELGPGRYSAVATVTLRRSGKQISRVIRRLTVRVS
jgi:hypothetical protein